MTGPVHLVPVIVQLTLVAQPHVPRPNGEHVLAGEYAAALDHVETLLSMPSDLYVWLLRLDPLWDPLRDHAHFQAILEEYE